MSNLEKMRQIWKESEDNNTVDVVENLTEELTTECVDYNEVDTEDVIE